MDDSATEKQKKFVRAIAMELYIVEPSDLSKSDATQWISDHIRAYRSRRRFQDSQFMDAMVDNQ